jgi:hypothetical protein
VVVESVYRMLTEFRQGTKTISGDVVTRRDGDAGGTSRTTKLGSSEGWGRGNGVGKEIMGVPDGGVSKEEIIGERVNLSAGNWIQRLGTLAARGERIRRGT